MPPGDEKVWQRKRQSWLGSASLAVLLAAYVSAPPASAEPEAMGVRTGMHPGWTRLVVDLDGAADYRLTASAAGRSLEIAIAELTWSDDLDARARSGFAGKGLIASIRSETDDAGRRSRIRLDFHRPAKVRRSFLLKPMEGKPYRLVVDLEPEKTERPVNRIAFALSTEPQPLRPPRPRQPDPAPAPSAIVMREEEDTFAGGFDFAPLAPEPPANGGGGGKHDLGGGMRGELSGNIEAELRLFPQSSLAPKREDTDLSLSFEPRYEIESSDGNHFFTIAPFLRLDLRDRGRTHVDIRELNWTGVFGDFEVRVGVDKVFWGVTESIHLVDIINQDDIVEDIDDEDRLGQPMASLAYTSPFGTLTGYILPYFRERIFPGPNGRPGFSLPVDRSQTQFEASGENWHPDWAVRWSHAAGPFDIGIAHFSGTSREPRLLPGLDGDGNPVLIPRYDLIDQTSIDLQATVGAMLFKFEGITSDGPLGRIYALAGGFEYTAYGLMGGDSDLGILAEFLYDDRGSGGPSPFEEDLFAGLRWSANDVQGTTLLAGAIFDLDTSSKAITIEASRRIGDSWRLSIDARLFTGAPPGDPLFLIRRDDFIQIRFGRYF